MHQLASEIAPLLQALPPWVTLPLLTHVGTAIGSAMVTLGVVYIALIKTVWEIKGMVRTIHDDHDKRVIDHAELERLKVRFSRVEREVRLAKQPISNPRPSGF